MRPSNNLENKTPSDTYCGVQVVWNGTTTRIQSGPDAFDIKVRCELFNHLGSHINIMQFQISSRRENW